MMTRQCVICTKPINQFRLEALPHVVTCSKDHAAEHTRRINAACGRRYRARLKARKAAAAANRGTG